MLLLLEFTNFLAPDAAAAPECDLNERLGTVCNLAGGGGGVKRSGGGCLEEFDASVRSLENVPIKK